jgi:hypothetical protein
VINAKRSEERHFQLADIVTAMIEILCCFIITILHSEYVSYCSELGLFGTGSATQDARDPLFIGAVTRQATLE